MSSVSVITEPAVSLAELSTARPVTASSASVE
jgi:hypothetical protein